MQSYPTRALDRRFQEDWARDAKEGLRVLMSLRVDFGPMGSEIYPEVHENPRAFFSSSSPILLEPFGHGSSDWSLPREDCIIPFPLKRI